jgi:hypothetical protein
MILKLGRVRGIRWWLFLLFFMRGGKRTRTAQSKGYSRGWIDCLGSLANFLPKWYIVASQAYKKVSMSTDLYKYLPGCQIRPLNANCPWNNNCYQFVWLRDKIFCHQDKPPNLSWCYALFLQGRQMPTIKFAQTSWIRTQKFAKFCGYSLPQFWCFR